MDKRTFLKNLGALSLATMPSMQALASWIDDHSHIPPESLADDEAFWEEIRRGYRLKPDYVNLENGYYCIQPEEILENYIEHIREVNYQGSYYMRTVQFENKKRIAGKLAQLVGCPKDELIITRNTTESLDMVIGGLNWEKGDEAVMAEQDYPAMLNHFRYVADRYGVVNKIVSVPNHPRSDEQIVELYERGITKRTKLLMICHMINITGQILPVRKICDMAHSHGVDVMVDGAHTVGHIVCNLEDLDCDYFGSSLHKWLSVPLGAGILHVKKKNIPKVWPLLAEGPRAEDDITRLNHLGTHPVHTDLAIENAIDYYNMIGPERKEARLRYLQRYWTAQVKDLPDLNLNTPRNPQRSCGIANVGVRNVKPSVLASELFKKNKIYTVAIDNAGVHGVRVTPIVFTSEGDLNRLIRALRDYGLSK